jgi:alpha-L-fucosidase
MDGKITRLVPVKKFLLLATLMVVVNLTLAQTAVVTSDANATAARIRWWREARFGMFIHYGPVTLTGKEISWSRANSNPKCPNKGPTPVAVYDNLYMKFDPTNFNAADWADVAKMAGMKYMVLTAKHCDGFLLWNSKVDGYNITATPFQRDLCAELSQAARQDGLRIGWYFSPMDWRDPDFRTERNGEFLKRMQGEIRELLSNYGRIDLLWFDFDGREAVYDQTNTYALVKKLQPQIIIDNRLDLGVKQSNRRILNPNADYYTPEQQIGTYDDQRPWETCMTICQQWAWKPNDKLKSPAEVVSILCRVVGGDGNLLLNVGPMPDGRIEPRQVEVLKQVGAWMDVNGESIYGTRGGPWKPTPALTSTRKGSVVYVHVLKADGDRIELSALPRKIKSASLLGGGEIKAETADGKFILHLPKKRDPLATVIKLNLDGSAMDIPALAAGPKTN